MMNVCPPRTLDFALWGLVVLTAAGLALGIGVWRVKREQLRRFILQRAQLSVGLQAHRLRIRPMSYKDQLGDTPWNPPVLTPQKAIEKRDEVLKEIADRQDDWMKRALEAFAQLPQEWTGLGENIRFDLLAAGLSPPRSPQTWGVLIGILVKRGLLVPTGERRPMTAEGSNGRKSDVYRRPQMMVSVA